MRFSPVDLPSVPGNSVQLAAGTRADAYLALAKGERVLTIVALTDDPPIALGTAQGVVKRVAASELSNKPEAELIALKPGDRLVGAGIAPDGAELIFIASDAQLLRFDASLVRPQGRAAGGMAGIKLAPGVEALWFGVVAPEASDPVVVTIAGASAALAGTDAGSIKVTPLAEFPAKGRATGGVRAQRFLRGEDALQFAWAGPSPALASSADGSVRALPQQFGKRDASGTPLDAPIGAIGVSVS